MSIIQHKNESDFIYYGYFALLKRFFENHPQKHEYDLKALCTLIWACHLFEDIKRKNVRIYLEGFFKHTFKNKIKIEFPEIINQLDRYVWRNPQKFFGLFKGKVLCDIEFQNFYIKFSNYILDNDRNDLGNRHIRYLHYIDCILNGAEFDSFGFKTPRFGQLISFLPWISQGHWLYLHLFKNENEVLGLMSARNMIINLIENTSDWANEFSFNGVTFYMNSSLIEIGIYNVKIFSPDKINFIFKEYFTRFPNAQVRLYKDNLSKNTKDIVINLVNEAVTSVKSNVFGRENLGANWCKSMSVIERIIN